MAIHTAQAKHNDSKQITEKASVLNDVH